MFPRSKQGTLANPPDLKGSKFKCLRRISDDKVCRLLQEISEGKFSIVEMLLQKAQLAYFEGHQLQ